jgi:hypothetical protein
MEVSRDPGRLETAALVALVVPFVGWIVGVVLVVLSRAWSRRDKIIGLLLALLPAILPLLFIAVGSSSGPETISPVHGGKSSGDAPVISPSTGDSGVGVLEVFGIVLLFLAGVPSALFLGWRLRRPD